MNTQAHTCTQTSEHEKAVTNLGRHNHWNTFGLVFAYEGPILLGPLSASSPPAVGMHPNTRISLIG
jgi:hypothetical protein